jgi:hypothetical protein
LALIIDQVHARKVVVAGDDAARSLVQLVEDHGVAELVMGAAADRAYTRYPPCHPPTWYYWSWIEFTCEDSAR